MFIVRISPIIKQVENLIMLKPSNYGIYSRIFDNTESTIVKWQNSLKIVQKYKGEEINILTIDDFSKQPINSIMIK